MRYPVAGGVAVRMFDLVVFPDANRQTSACTDTMGPPAMDRRHGVGAAIPRLWGESMVIGGDGMPGIGRVGVFCFPETKNRMAALGGRSGRSRDDDCNRVAGSAASLS
jgi:hypothetical protein